MLHKPQISVHIHCTGPVAVFFGPAPPAARPPPRADHAPPALHPRPRVGAPTRGAASSAQEPGQAPPGREFNFDFATGYARRLYGGAATPPEPPRGLLPARGRKESLFYSTSLPAIGLRDYVHRFVRYADVGPAVFVVAAVLLRRARARSAFLAACGRNVHRLLTAALLVAGKVVEDRRHPAGHYAAVGGIPSVEELGRLEIALLEFVGFRVTVSEQEFRSEKEAIEMLCWTDRDDRETERESGETEVKEEEEEEVVNDVRGP